MIRSDINDVIFNEILKRWYVLEWNTRVFNIADSKLWYLTPDQAQAFLDLEKSEDYQRAVISKEIHLINDNISEITQDIKDKPLNIIDLGCGDGKKAMLFISYLKDKKKIRYCPVDISWYMVRQAMEELEKAQIKEVIKCQWNISDFENLSNVSSLLRSAEYKDNFFLFLGNTLWNFEAESILYKIQNCMKNDDILLIGNGLNNKNLEEMMMAYGSDHLNQLLIKIPNQIGLEDDNLQFWVGFRRSRVEMYYIVKNDCRVRFLDKKIDFIAGDQIIVAFSYKYTKEDLDKHLRKYFSRVKLFFSEDLGYAISLCQK